ncbi:RNA-binding protein [Sulfurisphaera javensis]|uniref:RNA-binding protein n=1 Tax=Sulfurisphaera javensis TaxID=2049879 RepID=A0AAT9GPI5_9CREN
MQKHFLSEKEARKILSEIKNKYKIEIQGRIEVGKEKKEIYYFIDGVLSFFSDDLIPTLCFIRKYNLQLPSVVVDEGAVKHIVNGADLFVPGIVQYDCECKEGDIVLVKTKTNIPIAIIKVILDKEKALAEKKGKFGINLHYLNDKIWEMCNERSSGSNL